MAAVSVAAAAPAAWLFDFPFLRLAGKQLSSFAPHFRSIVIGQKAACIGAAREREMKNGTMGL